MATLYLSILKIQGQILKTCDVNNCSILSTYLHCWCNLIFICVNKNILHEHKEFEDIKGESRTRRVPLAEHLSSPPGLVGFASFDHCIVCSPIYSFFELLLQQPLIIMLINILKYTNNGRFWSHVGNSVKYLHKSIQNLIYTIIITPFPPEQCTHIWGKDSYFIFPRIEEI